MGHEEEYTFPGSWTQCQLLPQISFLKCGKSIPPAFEVVTNALFIISGIPYINP